AGGPSVGQDRLPQHGRRRGGLRRRAERHGHDLHQSGRPADRGLRVRSVRLRRGGEMTEGRETTGAGAGGNGVDAEVDALLDAAAEQPRVHPLPARRDSLDLQEQEIKDAVLRMGSLVEEAIRQASKALTAHDAELALDIIKADARINDAQREVSRLISVTIATQNPVARDLRYLLTLDHVTYEL